LSEHDSDVAAHRPPDLPRLPRDEGGPVFPEPWQAQAFAMAISLSQQGYFTWKEWATTLAEELEAAAARGEPDDGSRYYDHWLATLERLVTDKQLTNSAELSERTQRCADGHVASRRNSQSSSGAGA
jgi:nitrile hydratase accessory protein